MPKHHVTFFPSDRRISEEVKKQNLEIGGILPTDEEVSQYDSEGKPTFQLPLESKPVQSARRMLEEYIQ
jgi:CO dehydrogenase nickel-insertion accessory protein CooC1